MPTDDTRLIVLPSGDDDSDPQQVALALAGQAANRYAARGVFVDYLSRKATNTIRRQAADLGRFADYLNQVGEAVGFQVGTALAEFAEAVARFPEGGELSGDVWRGVTWGLVEGFRNWMVAQGDAVGSINVRLSTIKTYTKLATKAGVLAPEENALIRTVTGYSHKESRRVDERRPVSRRGQKKAAAVHISIEQAKELKDQPDTPQGRRDALMLCLLLEHGLRVGEIARLSVTDFDLRTGEMRFYRPKVDKVQIHKLTSDTLRAAYAWFMSGDAPKEGPLLRASRKTGRLDTAGMSERAITERVRLLGAKVGLDGLSAHDCRHYWATYWAGKVDVLRLQEAGGWNSLAMPRRYVEESKVANEGMA